MCGCHNVFDSIENYTAPQKKNEKIASGT